MITQEMIDSMTPEEVCDLILTLKNSGKVFIPFFWTEENIAEYFNFEKEYDNLNVEEHQQVNDVIIQLNDGDYDGSDFDMVIDDEI